MRKAKTRDILLAACTGGLYLIWKQILEEQINALKIIFPLLMVIGAVGSLVVNIIDKGEWATSLQWIGAGLLYTALTIRNIG